MGAIFTNFAAGTITDSPLTNVAAAINSANFASLPAVATPDFMYIVLDPAATAGVPEVVKITAHTLASTTVTVSRGQQLTQGGSAARQHNGGTTWIHALTALDLDAFPYRVVTTKGDIIVASGPTAVTRVPVTADQSFLRADSTQTSGIKWGNAGTLPIHASAAARDAAMSAPAVGQGAYIKSNDVNEGVYFNTSAGTVAPGIYRPAWNQPWGFIGLSAGAADQIGITSTQTIINGTLVTWTAVANRRYLLTAHGTLVQRGGAGNMTLRIWDNANGLVAYAPASGLAAGHLVPMSCKAVVSPGAGSFTYKLACDTTANTVDTVGSVQATNLLVQDIGPSGAPA